MRVLARLKPDGRFGSLRKRWSVAEIIELAHPPARVWQYSKPADFAPGSAAKRFSNSVKKNMTTGPLASHGKLTRAVRT